AAMLLSFVGVPLVLRVGTTWRSAMLFIVGAILAPLLFLAALSIWTPPRELIAGCLRGYALATDPRISSMQFFREGFGSDFPFQNTMKMAGYFFLYLLFLLPLALLSLVMRKPGIHRLVAVMLGASAVSAIFVFVPATEKFWPDFARGVPLLASLVCIFSIVATVKHRTHLSRSLFSVFAVAMLLRMSLNFRIYQYGFVQAAPAFILCCIAVVDWLPDLSAKRGGYTPMIRLSVTALIVGVVVIHLRISAAWLHSRKIKISDGGNTMIVDDRG